MVKGANNMLRKLKNFLYFDWEDFIKDKRLFITNLNDWKDFETGRNKGTKVECVIIEDKTDYGDVSVSNRFEKIVIKIPKKLDISVNQEIRIIEGEASVYGEFYNNLSIVAKDIELVKQGK